MDFIRNPECLPLFIEAIERDFNFLADTFCDNISEDNFDFDVFYTICNDADLLSVYNCGLPNLVSPLRVRKHFNLLTEMVLRGAKRIWLNPRNKLRKQITGLFMITILYVNQPMPGFPTKIPLSSKDLLCIIAQLHQMLVRSLKKEPKMRSICKQVGHMLQRLIINNAVEFVLESEYYNILKHTRIIINTYEKLDLAEIKQSQIQPTAISQNTCQNSDKQGSSSSTTVAYSAKEHILEKLRKSENLDTKTKNFKIEAGDHVKNSLVCKYSQEQDQLQNSEPIFSKFEVSEAYGGDSNCKLEDSDDDFEDCDSELDESATNDDYDFLLSTKVPQLEKKCHYQKTDIGMSEGEEAMKFLMRKSTFQSSTSTISKIDTEEGRRKANVDLILKKIKMAEEKCFREKNSSQVSSQDNECAFPPELLKLKQAADESVKLRYGISCQKPRMTEKTWLSKEVSDATRAMSIFNMHENGTLEEKEGIRLVTKYVGRRGRDVQVLVARATEDTNENFHPNESKKRRRLTDHDKKICLNDIRDWDPYFYQPKYINSYHKQLQKAVENSKHSNERKDRIAEIFAKRFRKENETPVRVEDESDVAMSKEGEEDDSFSKKSVGVVKMEYFNDVPTITSPYKSSPPKVLSMPSLDSLFGFPD